MRGRYACDCANARKRLRSIEDRWYSPGATYFRVAVESGDRYILRHDDVEDLWTLQGFRSA
jgi:hypothetical protein